MGRFLELAITIIALTSTDSALTLPRPNHEWDFRGCRDGDQAKDTFSSISSYTQGATCVKEGLHFSGVKDYLSIGSWSWGGVVTFEIMLAHDDVGTKEGSTSAQVFGFQKHDGSGAEECGIDLISDMGVLSAAHFRVRSGRLVSQVSALKMWETQQTTSEHYVHCVIVCTGGQIILYKNGQPSGAHAEEISPSRCTRDLTLGAGVRGTIAYFRVWHGLALDAGRVQGLFARRHVQALFSVPQPAALAPVAAHTEATTKSVPDRDNDPFYSILRTQSPAAQPPQPLHEKRKHGRNRERKARIAVLMVGQSSRWRQIGKVPVKGRQASTVCENDGIVNQAAIAATQHLGIFETITVIGSNRAVSQKHKQSLISSF